MTPEYLSGFGGILLFILGGIIFVLFAFFVASMIRPKRPDAQKLSPYECGEEAVGNVWTNFNVRFYVVALLFLLFEVELVILFPWAVVFSDKESISKYGNSWYWIALGEISVFILLLLVGLAYAWKKGYLDWIKPEPEVEKTEPVVPASLYEAINKKYEQ